MSKVATMPLFIAQITKELTYNDGTITADSYFPHPLVFPDENTAVASCVDAVKDVPGTTLDAVWHVGSYSPVDGSIKIFKERKKVYPYENAQETE